MLTSVYKRLLQLGKVAGSLTFLFGVPYGIYEYIDNQHAKRIEHTLSFYRMFNSSPFTTYRENISSALASNSNNIIEAAKDEKRLEATIVKVIQENDIEKDILLVMDFYDGLVVCILKGLCDADTTERLFSSRAYEVYMTFYQYIQRLRATSASREFGLGLETIAKTKRVLPRE